PRRTAIRVDQREWPNRPYKTLLTMEGKEPHRVRAGGSSESRPCQGIGHRQAATRHRSTARLFTSTTASACTSSLTVFTPRWYGRRLPAVTFEPAAITGFG